MKQSNSKPNTFRVAVSVLACKLLRTALRLLGRGGTNLPGKVALKLCPDILSVTSCGMRVIVVSGTNGKTTTCRMIEQNIRGAGMSYLANRSGANLLAGITAEFVANASLLGKPTKSVAVIECDEASMNGVLGQLTPEVIVLTNIFRDQLDRYGEVAHTREILKSAIEKAPEAVLCLNGDDSLVASIGQALPNPCLYYGINCSTVQRQRDLRSDAMYCIHCKNKYEYSYITYGHLGGFRCPNCGYGRPTPQIAVGEILQQDQNGSLVELNVHGETVRRLVPLPGDYNIYNFLGAYTALDAFGITEANVQAPEAFGRMERFDIGQGVTMILVKNPAGFSQAISYLCGLEQPFDWMCCLNDNDADGTDISWIWDVPFENIVASQRLHRVYVSGTRKEELRLRLKYAGLQEQMISVVTDEPAFLRDIRRQERPMVITPTYTAMMKCRKQLARQCGRKAFWR